MTDEPLSLKALTVAHCLNSLSKEEKAKIFSGNANETPPFCIVTVLALCFDKNTARNNSMCANFMFESREELGKELESDDPFGIVKIRNVVDLEWYHVLVDKWKELGCSKNLHRLKEEEHIHVELFWDAKGILCSQFVFTRVP